MLFTCQATLTSMNYHCLSLFFKLGSISCLKQLSKVGLGHWVPFQKILLLLSKYIIVGEFLVTSWSPGPFDISFNATCEESKCHPLCVESWFFLVSRNPVLPLSPCIFINTRTFFCQFFSGMNFFVLSNWDVLLAEKHCRKNNFL